MRPLKIMFNRCCSIADGAIVRRRFHAIRAAGWWMMVLMGLLIATPPGRSATIRSGKSGAEILLARAGQARLPIVVSPKASEPTRKVATELADFLQRITGATFTIETGDGSAGIVLGTLTEFPKSPFAKTLKIRNVYDGREAYVIHSERKRLLLLGATEQGASHATFRFLELVGCRRFFPAKEWEVIPSIPALKVSVHEADRPAMLSRSIWYGGAFFFDENGADRRSTSDYLAWCRHNRMNSYGEGNLGSLQIANGHAWQSIIAERSDTFKKHPEYLSLVGGKRQGVQLCVSNPEVRALVAQWVLDRFAKKPDLDMVSLEPSDGGRHCECEQCAQLGSVSDRVFGLANEVARKVNQAYPGKMIGLLAYNDHATAPSFPLEPNVSIQLATGLIFGNRSFDELLEDWPKVCQHLGVYDYFSVFMWNYDALGAGVAGNTRAIRERIANFAAHQVNSMSAESTCSWGPHGIGYYLASKLMWNPKANGQELLEDFYTRAFGPASTVMKRFYERNDGANNVLACPHTYGLGYRDLQEASRLAADRPDVLARLDHIKQYMHYLYLRERLANETEPARKKELTVAILTHAWRTRYSYMNDTIGMLVTWTATAAKEFNEPSWSSDASIFPGRGMPRPWFRPDLISHEETETNFKEGLAAFKVLDIEERKFSADLVPVRFDETPPVEKYAFFLGVPPRYVFCSIRGESITGEIGAGNLPGAPDLRYRLADSAGKVVAAGSVPNDDKRHPFEFKVTRPGLYYLDHSPTSGGATAAMWRTSDQPWIILLDDEVTTAGTFPELFFYVPGGTRQVQFYYRGHTAGNKIRTSDGTVVAEIPGLPGAMYAIPVPPGADGQRWSIGGPGPGRLRFFNIPNYVSPSPNGLLVPREVATADKLTILK